MSFYSTFLPERMIAEGKETVEVFDEEESIYMRCWSDAIDGDQAIGYAIGFPILPEFSVNRSFVEKSQSEQEDVLRPIYLDWGILEMKVSDIPNSLTRELDGNVYDLYIKHEPEPFNYAHSNMYLLNQTTRKPLAEAELKSNKTDKKFKTFVRGEIARMVAVVKTANISKSEWGKVREERNLKKSEIELIWQDQNGTA